MTNPDIKERLRRWRERMPGNWYGNKDLDDALSHIEALEVTLGLKERMLSTCEAERADLQQRIKDRQTRRNFTAKDSTNAQ